MVSACFRSNSSDSPQRYGVVPKGLFTFLGFLGNAEFSPWKRTPEVNKKIKKKFMGVFVRASDVLFGKDCLCYPQFG